jgi:hypothetical protein
MRFNQRKKKNLLGNDNIILESDTPILSLLFPFLVSFFFQSCGSGRLGVIGVVEFNSSFTFQSNFLYTLELASTL